MGEGGIKNGPKDSDVFYGRPLSGKNFISWLDNNKRPVYLVGAITKLAFGYQLDVTKQKLNT